MIQKFRWKFIGTSVAALLLVLLITLGGLIGITRVQSKNEVDRVLTALVKNEGHLSPRNAHAALGNQNDPINRNFLGGPYNPEAVYQYRYFAHDSSFLYPSYLFRLPTLLKFRLVRVVESYVSLPPVYGKFISIFIIKVDPVLFVIILLIPADLLYTAV